MGANEHGVVIGNEALFSKEPAGKEPGLIGMDFLRLGLERSTGAEEALQTIIALLETHGQGGNCGFMRKLFYHNSFIIADPQQAWVLETSGQHWAAKRIEGIYTISNGLTIEDDWDACSPDLKNFAADNGWCGPDEKFSFARCYSDRLYTTLSDCRNRRSRTTELLENRRGAITVNDMVAILRDHGSEEYHPAKGLTGAAVCMHSGFGPIRMSQTTGSFISHLSPDLATHFVTATAAPCTSIFKPVWLDAGLPDLGPVPDGAYDKETLFWRHEKLHRTTLRDYTNLIGLYRSDRDELETRFINEALLAAYYAPEMRLRMSERCFKEADMAETLWLEKIILQEKHSTGHLLYDLAWHRFNRDSGIKA